MPKVVCRGCDEEYFCKDYASIKSCAKCGIETCVECGRWYRGRIYCGDCKPIETNYYDRSVE